MLPGHLRRDGQDLPAGTFGFFAGDLWLPEFFPTATGARKVTRFERHETLPIELIRLAGNRSIPIQPLSNVIRPRRAADVPFELAAGNPLQMGGLRQQK